ncbi:MULTISPECIES: hypothetical protein [Lysinibacillus]|uniref:Uncharacterized protein n=1 Tax=Lysinibacillus sphaericus CBAM5 TaxID=1400869 RepID=W7RSC4_LYSSH|nr:MULTISPECIES: hypothetical protein [Lysinibacillus]EWH33424.1 hypothetical protein P799_10585 [Lysinibacillus sphaericus CBAM5]
MNKVIRLKWDFVPFTPVRVTELKSDSKKCSLIKIEDDKKQECEAKRGSKKGKKRK